MPTYKYECTGCGAQLIEHMTIAAHDDFGPIQHDRLVRDDAEDNLVYCGVYKQVYEFRVAKVMPEHYSDTLNSIVKSEKDFLGQLHEKSRSDSERHGFDVNYEAVDPTDPSSAGVTEVGLESQARAHHDDALT